MRDTATQASARATTIGEAWRRERGSFVVRARRVLGSAPDAEDIVQEAALAALGRGESLRDETRLGAWVGRIVERKALDAARRSSRAAKLASTVSPAELVAPPRPEPRCACVRTVAQTLRAPHAEVLRRVDERGEPLAVVAASLGITPNALSVRLFRARAELRATMKRHCGTTDLRSCDACACRWRACCPLVDD